MGRGLGNGGAAWEGPPELRSPTGPGSRPRPPPASSPSPTSSRAPVPTRPLPNRTKLRSQEPSHAASEPHKRRENGGQGPTEIAEGAGAHGAARGGGKSRARGRPAAGDERRGTGTGGVGASAVGCLRPPARLLPPSETRLLQWLAGRPGFPSVGGVRGTACSLHRVCLRLPRTAMLLSGRFHFSLQPQAALPPPTKPNPRPSPVTLYLKEKTLWLHPRPRLQTVHPQRPYPTGQDPSLSKLYQHLLKKDCSPDWCLLTNPESIRPGGRKGASHLG